jgi:hypothetical protein
MKQRLPFLLELTEGVSRDNAIIGGMTTLRRGRKSKSMCSIHLHIQIINEVE